MSDENERGAAYVRAQTATPEKQAGLGMIDAVLAQGDVTQADVLVLLAKRLPPPGWAVTAAQEQVDDDLEIDDTPMSSETDAGCWVSAWVWAPAPLFECDECGEEFKEVDMTHHLGQHLCTTCKEALA